MSLSEGFDARRSEAGASPATSQLEAGGRKQEAPLREAGGGPSTSAVPASAQERMAGSGAISRAGIALQLVPPSYIPTSTFV